MDAQYFFTWKINIVKVYYPVSLTPVTFYMSASMADDLTAGHCAAPDELHGRWNQLGLHTPCARCLGCTFWGQQETVRCAFGELVRVLQ